MILPRLLLLAWLYAATSLAVAIVHTSSDPHDEVRTLTARKTAAVFMGFPALRCSTSGVSETVTSDRCVRLRAGTKSLRVEEITSGCKRKVFFFGFGNKIRNQPSSER